MASIIMEFGRLNSRPPNNALHLAARNCLPCLYYTKMAQVLICPFVYARQLKREPLGGLPKARGNDARNLFAGGTNRKQALHEKVDGH